MLINQYRYQSISNIWANRPEGKKIHFRWHCNYEYFN